MYYNKLLLKNIVAILCFFMMWGETIYADYTVSGTLKYEDLTQDRALGFKSITKDRPVRYADIVVVSGTDVVSQGATNESGFFSLTVTASSTQNVKVYVITTTENTGSFDLKVVGYEDGIRTGNPYAYELFHDINQDPNTNVDIGELTAAYHNGGDEFNIFDIGIDALSYLINEMGETPPLPELIVEFTFRPNGVFFAFWNGISVSIDGAYGYDDAILLHEMGHYMQTSFGGFSDNPGGSHYIGDSQQNPTLSFGEAWPTFMGTNIRVHYNLTTGNDDAYHHPSVYMNSNGSIDGGQGFAYDLENTHEWMKGKGAASEVAVTAAMWDLTDGADTPDFEPGVDDDEQSGYGLDRDVSETWNLMTNYLSQPPFEGYLTYEDWHDEWIANISNPQAQALTDMQNYQHGIQYLEDTHEPNDSLTTATTIENTPYSIHGITYPEGDEDWFKFSAVEFVTYKISTSNMFDGADTFLKLMDSTGNAIGLGDNVDDVGQPPGAFEALSSEIEWTAPATGDYFVRVTRSPHTTWGGGTTSKYGNWDFKLFVSELPPMLPRMKIEPEEPIVILIKTDEIKTDTIKVTNLGQQQDLIYNFVEYDINADSVKDFSWMEVNPSEGTLAAGQYQLAIVTFYSTGLDKRTTYEGALQLESNDIRSPLTQIPVTVRIVNTPTIERFTPHTITTEASGAGSVYAADIDGDGDIDVLSASEGDNRIIWYENNGRNMFTSHTITTDARDAQSVFAADVDGDGDMDILSASEIDDEIAWYENIGSQEFVAYTITEDANGAVSVFAIDVDSDGDMDVLSASENDDKIAWYENNGSQVFIAHTISSEADNAQSVYAADVDGDGDIDVLSASSDDNKIAYYVNDGSEDFTEVLITTDAIGATSVYAADVDGDGDRDVLSASSGNNKIVWYENRGIIFDRPLFIAHVPITTDANGATSVYAKDVDGDGDMDVLSASKGDEKIAWYENDGSAVFITHTITKNAMDASSVFAIDLDSDGDIDVLSSSTDDNKIAWYENPMITITDIAESDPLIPVKPYLYNNYPNPFNPETTIKYQLTKVSQVRLKVYNLLGQVVMTLVNEQQSAGVKTVVWDSRDIFGNQVSSGIYIYRLEAGDFVESKKMILLK